MIEKKISSGLRFNPVYKALTRSSSFLGVPITPFLLTMGGLIIVSMWTNLVMLITLPFAFLILKIIAKIDEKIFSLVGLRRFLFLDRLKAKKIKKKIHGNLYSGYLGDPFVITDKKIRNDLLEYTMLDIRDAINLNKIIPYSSHIENEIIVCNDGSLVSTWLVEGLSYTTRSDESLERFKETLNTVIKSLSSDNVSIYTHCVRDFTLYDLNPKFNLSFAKEISDLYVGSFKDKDFMKNSIFVSLIFKNNSSVFSKKLNEFPIVERLERFFELSTTFESNISKYNIYKLTCYEENNKKYSQQLEFYNYLLTGYQQKILVSNTPIYNYMGNVEMLFSKDIVSITHNDKKIFARGIELKDWVSATKTGILDTIISVPCRYVLTQSFTMQGKAEAKNKIDKQIKQLKSTNDDAISQLNDLYEAKDELISGNIAFGDHHFSLIVYGETQEELKRNCNLLVTKLIDEGFLTTYSNLAFEEAFFAQLPCNFKFRTRLSSISSLNFADMNSLHNNTIGKQHNNCWGEALVLLKTTSIEPFYFNLHQVKIGRNDFGEAHLGHSLLIGKSGVGKTANMSFLLNMLTQYMDHTSFPENDKNKKMTMIYFDKDYGAEANIRALNGKHNLLEKGKPTGFNPFMIESTNENIYFLTELVCLMAGHDGSLVNSKDKEQINRAVISVMDMPKNLRIYGVSRLLENIQDEISESGTLKKRLLVWKNGNLFGWIFDNEFDSLDFEAHSIFGFDGTEILDQKSISSVISFYLLKRIMQIADGRRLVIFLDEFWKWLQGETFREFVYDGLKTLRKRNGILICATQSPDEIIKSEISRAILEQTETFLFLPNDKASPEEYIKFFGCSEKEYQLIKNFDPSSRQFLIKKGNESEGDTRGNTSIIKLDLSCIGRRMKILSLSTDNVNLLRGLVSQYESPSEWIPIFLEKAI